MRIIYLGYDDVAIQSPVQGQVSLHAHQAVLLPVVEPVAGPPCPDDPLQLVGLDPDYLVHPLIAPELEALPAQLHGPTGYPQKYEAIVLS